MIKMIKRGILFLLVLILLFSSGCTNSDKDSVDFNKGIKGIEIYLLEDTPPSEIWEESSFSVLVQLQNKGASGIKDVSSGTKDSPEGGYVAISGYSPVYINSMVPNTANGKNSFTLAAMNAYNPEGGDKIMSFRGTVGNLKNVNYAYIDQPIVATACYVYRTLLSPAICISDSSIKKIGDVCGLEDLDFKEEGQGAPVAVTQIEHKMSPSADGLSFDNYFILHFKNLGTGTVVRHTTMVNEDCSSKLSKEQAHEELNTIFVQEFILFDDVYFKAGIGGTHGCERMDPYEQLDDKHEYDSAVLLNRDGEGIATFSCKLDNTKISSKPYITPLNIKLKYGYRQSVSKTMRINKRGSVPLTERT